MADNINNNDNDDLLLFADDSPAEEMADKTGASTLMDDISSADIDQANDSWKVLIVDDEPDVHTVTTLALGSLEYKNKAIEFLSAYSAAECREMLSKHTDIALILLDVVMEETNSGLKLVKFIRNELKNPFVRIIIRTGQPGEAPEKEVINTYDINDYKLKTEVTSARLYTVVMSSLRTYDSLLTVEKYRRDLENQVDYKSKEIELQQAELLELISTKEKVLSIISHDLQNPYSSFISTSELLSDFFEQMKREGKEDVVKQIKKSGKQLNILLDGLINWTRNQKEKIPFNPQDLLIKDTIESCFNMYRPRAIEKQLKLKADITDAHTVFADKTMVNVIFRNLISNAVKFANPNTEVVIKAEAKNDDLQISVRDMGIGMTNEQVNSIFDVNYEASDLTGPHRKGLGLILTKECVEKNKGRISVNSQPNNGTEFVITLPSTRTM